MRLCLLAVAVLKLSMPQLSREKKMISHMLKTLKLTFFSFLIKNKWIDR